MILHQCINSASSIGRGPVAAGSIIVMRAAVRPHIAYVSYYYALLQTTTNGNLECLRRPAYRTRKYKWQCRRRFAAY
eukprot:scaffold353641_cov20-Prasinocladus_malaysianus.AAC.1